MEHALSGFLLTRTKYITTRREFSGRFRKTAVKWSAIATTSTAAEAGGEGGGKVGEQMILHRTVCATVNAIILILL